ncbi:MAG: hypothetical protein KDA92_26990, partial [Planctomycetales bacterium]|nr:hypothetical protein [Planctomycetales bacterium]
GVDVIAPWALFGTLGVPGLSELGEGGADALPLQPATNISSSSPTQNTRSLFCLASWRIMVWLRAAGFKRGEIIGE